MRHDRVRDCLLRSRPVPPRNRQRFAGVKAAIYALRHDLKRWQREWGLVWPSGAASMWLRNSDVRFATLLAPPVWVALGLWWGPQLRAPSGWIAWTSLILMQPILEELVFRGLLQGQALRWLATKPMPHWLTQVSMANILVTLCFVAAHLRTHPSAWALALWAPSLVLGHLRERTGSVWPPVFVHIFYNTGFGLTAWWVLPAV